MTAATERAARADGTPIWPTATWRAVTARAGGRCECAKRACGRTHTRERGKTVRCPARLSAGDRIYVVGPPGLSDTQLAQLPADQLTAYCLACADGVARLAGHGKRAKRTEPPPRSIGPARGAEGQVTGLAELEAGAA